MLLMFAVSISLAVVEQRFVIEVYDEFVTVGNSGVLRCHIPAFMRDVLTISAWVEGLTNYILADHSDQHQQQLSQHRHLSGMCDNNDNKLTNQKPSKKWPRSSF